MNIRSVIMVWGIVLWLTMFGCAGTGEVVLVDIPAQRPATVATSALPAGLRFAVESFEDSRSSTSHLGTWSYVWGGESSFDVQGGSSGDAAAHALVRYLNQNGWQARSVKSGAVSDADLTISGRLLVLSLDAKSRFGSTELTTTTKITIRALNGADGSTVRMTLNGAGAESVFWFEPDDAQQLVNAVLDDSFSRLLQSIRVDGKVLRLRD